MKPQYIVLADATPKIIALDTNRPVFDVNLRGNVTVEGSLETPDNPYGITPVWFSIAVSNTDDTTLVDPIACLRLTGPGSITILQQGLDDIGAAATVDAIDAVIAAYAANVAAAGGSIGVSQQVGLSVAVAFGKATGIWSKITELGLFAGGTIGVNTSGCAVKIKAPVTLTGTLNNFVGADLTAKGLKSNGSTKWFNTLTTPNQLTGDGAMGMWCFLTEEVTQPGFGQFCGTNAGSNPQITLRWQAVANSVDGQLGGIGASAGNAQYSRAVIGVGLLGIQRVGTTLGQYHGGYSTVSVGSGFTYSPNATALGVFSGDGGASAIACTLGGYAFTDGTITDADALNLAIMMDAMQLALGRFVPATRPFNARLIVGQSLAVGSTGSPVVSTTQPYTNQMMTSGVLSGNTNSGMPGYINSLGQAAKVGSLSPLVENGLETIASGAANTIGMLARADGQGAAQDMVIANLGLGATAYSGLAKGTNPYANSLVAMNAFKTSQPLYTNQGIRFQAIWVVHGESDMLNGSYDLNIRQWQADYQADLNAISGRSDTIPMIHTQPSCWTSVNNVNGATGVAPQLMLNESRANPTKTILAGAKYHLLYGADGVHPANGVEYTKLSGMEAKFDWYRVVKGIALEPLTIDSIVRVGAVLTIQLRGGTGNIVADTAAVTDPSGASNTLGIEWESNIVGAANRYTAFSSVVITDAVNKIVTATLAVDPTGSTNMFCSVAWTGIPGNSAGPTTGPRACIRDSDPFTDVYGNVIRGWICHQRVSVT